jgi:hypothetical protein
MNQVSRFSIYRNQTSSPCICMRLIESATQPYNSILTCSNIKGVLSAASLFLTCTHSGPWTQYFRIRKYTKRIIPTPTHPPTTVCHTGKDQSGSVGVGTGKDQSGSVGVGVVVADMVEDVMGVVGGIVGSCVDGGGVTDVVGAAVISSNFKFHEVKFHEGFLSRIPGISSARHGTGPCSGRVGVPQSLLYSNGFQMQPHESYPYSLVL